MKEILMKDEEKGDTLYSPLYSVTPNIFSKKTESSIFAQSFSDCREALIMTPSIIFV